MSLYPLHYPIFLLELGYSETDTNTLVYFISA